MQSGMRYGVSLTLDKAAERHTGFIRLLDQAESEELSQRRRQSLFASNGSIEFLLYLLSRDLYGEAKQETARLLHVFPENSYLKGLSTYLSGQW